MVATVEEGFEEYLRRLAPLGTEVQAAKKHEKSLSSSVKNAFPGATLLPTGSFGNGTAIKQYSDVDYFAVIPRGLVGPDSADILRRVRATLKTTFRKTPITVRMPAVIVPFGTEGRESIDVVPALVVAKTPQGQTIYDIPDRDGHWMRSSPLAHKAYVRALDRTHQQRVKPLVMLMKAWKAYWDVPILSFYLEMRVARYAASVKTIDYGRGIEKVLESMIGPSSLTVLRDPLGLAGSIHPCSTTLQEQQALMKVRRGLARAVDARKHNAAGSARKAIDRWDLFFHGTFPAYR